MSIEFCDGNQLNDLYEKGRLRIFNDNHMELKFGSYSFVGDALSDASEVKLNFLNTKEDPIESIIIRFCPFCGNQIIEHASYI